MGLPSGKTFVSPFKHISKKMADNCPLSYTHTELLMPFGYKWGAHRKGQKLKPEKKAKWTSPYNTKVKFISRIAKSKQCR